MPPSPGTVMLPACMPPKTHNIVGQSEVSGPGQDTLEAVITVCWNFSEFSKAQNSSQLLDTMAVTGSMS